MRMRKKKNLIPRMERCGDRLIREPYAMPGQVAGADAPGPGAAAGAGLRQGPLHRRHRRGGAGRAVHRCGAGAGRHGHGHGAVCGRRGSPTSSSSTPTPTSCPCFFAPGEVDRIYINFCDPWPSNRHAKRRLTHGNFLRLYRQVLKMGGQIHFKTDNQDLFDLLRGGAASVRL